MRKYLTSCGLIAVSLISLGFSGAASAGKGGNNECPVGLVNGKTLDEEFGEGTQELTRCLQRRHNVKLLVQINQYCAKVNKNDSTVCDRAYALTNIDNVIADYETTYGMRPGRDYEIAAVVHSGGGPLVIQDGTTGDGVHFVKNEFEAKVQDLMNKGVRFYFCQNTTRGYQSPAQGLLPPGDATAYLVTSTDENGVEHSVEYVTAGITALADFQAQGFEMVQP